MKITINSKNLILSSLVLISFVSYFLGYSSSENSAGGGEADFKFVWRNLQTFNNYDLLEAIKLTAVPNDELFQSSRTPGFYVFNKLFNPLTYNEEFFKFSIFLISIAIPITFFLCLKNNFKMRKDISSFNIIHFIS